MNDGPLFDPDMLKGLDIFTERLTFEESIPTPKPSGQLIDAWIPIDDLTGIPAMVEAVDSVSLGEQSGVEGEPVIVEYVATLDGIYPQVSDDMRVTWYVHGIEETPFTRGEFGDEVGAAVVTCEIVRRVPSPIETTLIIREVPS